MQDSIQQGLQTLAMQSGVTREIAVVCAAVLIYVMGAEWLLTLFWRRASVSVATVARVALLALVAYLVSKVLSGLIVDPRPYIVAHVQPIFPVAHDNGFPSDHTLLAALLTASLWWIDRRMVPLFAAATVLVMVGRLAIGAHHTLDVAGSVAIVAAVALALGVLPLPQAWDRPLLAHSGRHGLEESLRS